MKQAELEMMRGMVTILNEASNAYYNTGNPIMTDEQFDARLEDLRQFEEETGFVLANSPTINVGYKVLTELKEISHSHSMLSLEKVHTIDELLKFINGKETIASIKLDGLTCSLTYKEGVLVSAETRGNGYVGSDITEHIKQFKNVPFKINKEGTYIIDGEAIITDEDFAEINKNNEYKNSRNLASGTLSVLDTSLVAQRKLSFFAWDIIEGGNSNSLKDNLIEARELGFDTTPFWFVGNSANALNLKNLQSNIDFVFDYAQENGYPNDGVVFKFDDIEYGKSLGKTEHHFKNGVAYKRKDEVCETRLLDIEWSCGKSGILTPVAIFKPVELEGTIVERASLHNISVMYDLYPKSWHSGLKVSVKKCNQIIPQISKVEFEESPCPKRLDPPHKCPICGGNTEIKQDNDSKVLVCTNDNCKGKLLGKLTHFVSKNAINVDGLSESTLEKFIELGWLNDFEDIFTLKDHFTEMLKLDGFGETSANKLLNAIEASKNTTLDRFIYSLSIPLIGRSASKTIAKYFDYDFNKLIDNFGFWSGFDWTKLNDFGSAMSESMDKFITENVTRYFVDLPKYFIFEKPQVNSNSNNLADKVFCITGSLNHFANRDEAKEKIESAGGKVSNSVNKKTNCLICNETSSSSKYKKAKELNIEILTEEEFIVKYGVEI